MPSCECCGKPGRRHGKHDYCDLCYADFGSDSLWSGAYHEPRPSEPTRPQGPDAQAQALERDRKARSALNLPPLEEARHTEETC